MAAPPEDSPAPDRPAEGHDPSRPEADEDEFWDLGDEEVAPGAAGEENAHPEGDAGTYAEEEGAYVENLEEAGPEYEVVEPRGDAGEPAAEEYEAEPAAEEYETEPAAEEYETEPAAEEYEAEPAAEEYETEPAGEEYEAEPAGEEYEAEPAAEEYETEPAAEEYEAEPAAEEYEAEPAAEEYEAEPAAEEYEAEPAAEEYAEGEYAAEDSEREYAAEESDEEYAEVEEAPEETGEEYHEEPGDLAETDLEPVAEEEYVESEESSGEERYTDEDIAAEELEAAREQQEDLAAAPADGSPESSRRFQFIALAIGALTTVVIVIGFLAYALKDIGAGSASAKLKFPVAGERITISAADTYWRKPDREKDRGVRLAARVIPAAAINISDTKGSGALRFFFEDDGGSTVGDPITMTVSNGVFAHNSATQTEVHATHGFTDEGDHAAYLTDQIETWHLVVKEGPGPDAAGRDFKDVVRIPISKQRR